MELARDRNHASMHIVVSADGSADRSAAADYTTYLHRDSRGAVYPGESRSVSCTVSTCTATSGTY